MNVTKPTAEDMARDLAGCACPACRRALWAEAEVERLREMHAAACDRIAGQSELLGRRAEK